MASCAVLESISLSLMPYLTAWVRRSVFVVSRSGPIPSFVNFWMYCFTLFTSIRPAHWALVGFADAKYLAMSIAICFASVSECGLRETKSNSWWSLRAMAPRQCQSLVGAFVEPRVGATFGLIKKDFVVDDCWNASLMEMFTFILLGSCCLADLAKSSSCLHFLASLMLWTWVRWLESLLIALVDLHPLTGQK